MGSKRTLAPNIAALINAEHPTATVLDAFAGMCAIGCQLAPKHRVIANDVHAFAATVARALLTTPGIRPERETAIAELTPSYSRNAAALAKTLRKRLDLEHQALARADDGDWRTLMRFTLDEIAKPTPRQLPGLPTEHEYQRRTRRVPFALFSMYYASAYFGVRQALEIDSLRYAIERASPENRDVYLYALIQACSHCVAAPGHFAQHLVPRDMANTMFIARMRRRSIVARFWAALSNLTIPACLHRAGNSVHRNDATTYLQELAINAPAEVDELVIYADPPYSKAQYSRYYHVLETLVLYDYPGATGKGRYRKQRFETNFSRAAQVESEMNQFVEAAAATGASLYLSYPRNGLLLRRRRTDLRDLMRNHYPRVRLAMTKALSHSTMGGAPGAATMNVIEDVYYGGWE
ncbi:MAG: DNA adenine methylase [Burkholderiaceae bacterium]|nr:DNA adenine methylase [Burkholderiaceae bacterium]